MADGLLSDDDVGLGSTSAPATSSSPASFGGASADGGLSSGARGLTVRGSGASSLLSDADVGLMASGTPAPAQPGALANSGDESWASSALKGAATAGIRGLSSIPGRFGDVSNLADLLVAGGEHLFTGQPVGDIVQNIRTQRDAQDAQSPLRSVLPDPRGFMPSSADVAAPVLSRTGAYDPSSEWGRVAQAGTEALVGGTGPGAGNAVIGIPLRSLAAGAAKMAPANFVSGAAAQGTTDATGNPYLGLAAGLVAPMAADAGVAAASRLTPLGRDAAVGRMIRDASQDPAAVNRSLGLGDVVDGASSVAIPGSKPTTGQVTGDLGLLQAENQARTANNVPWIARDQDQNTARQATLDRLQPTGDAMAPAQTMRQHLDAVDQAAQEAEDRLAAAHANAVERHTSDLDASLATRAQSSSDAANRINADLIARTEGRTQGALDDADSTTAARQAAHDQLTQQFQDQLDALRQQSSAGSSALGPQVNPEDAGALLRGRIEAMKGQVSTVKSGLYTAVDADGTLNAVVAPLKKARADILGAIDPHFGVQPSGAEAALHGAIAQMPDVVPFKSLQTLDTRVSAAMSGARRNPDPNDPQALSRLTQLKGAVLDAINNGVENQRAYEQRAVALGAMDRGNTVDARLQGYAETLGNARGGGGQRGAAYGTDTAQPSSSAGLYRAGESQGRRSDDLQGGSGVPEAPVFTDQVVRRPSAPVKPRPQSLTDFIRAQGGMQDPGGDLKAMGMDQVRGFIAKPGEGLHPDRMREAAAEAGYLGADVDHAMANTTIGDLLDHVGSTNPVYSVRDEDTLHRWNAYDQGRSEFDRFRDDPVAQGVRPQQRPASAYTPDDIYPPGTAPRDNLEPGLKPNFDQSAAERLAAAKASHIDYAQTYKQGPVADVLETNGYAGQYTTQDGRVAGRAVVSGNTGYETAKSFLKAAKTDPEAVTAMQQVALNNLRGRLGPDGAVTNAALSKWKSDYAGALRALDEVSPGFSAAHDTAAKATDALVAEGARQKVALTAFKQEQARQALLDQAARRDALGKANAADRDEVKALLAERASDDKAIGATETAQTKAAIARSAAETKAGIGQARSLRKTAQAMPGAELATKTAPIEVENAMGRMLTEKRSGPTNMRAMVRSLDPDGLEGARKAAADWIGRTLLNTAELGTSGRKGLSTAGLDKLLRDGRPALEALFPKESVNTLQALALEQQRANRTWTATANKGQSPTSKNLYGLVKKAAEGHGHSSFMGSLLGFGGAEALEHVLAGGLTLHTVMLGAGGAVGLGLNSLRKRETEARQALFTDALLNPERARFYLQKVPQDGGSSPLKALTASVRRELIAAPLVVRSQQQRRDGYAGGGRTGLTPGRVDPRQIDVAVEHLSAAAGRVQRELGMATGRMAGAYG